MFALRPRIRKLIHCFWPQVRWATSTRRPTSIQSAIVSSGLLGWAAIIAVSSSGLLQDRIFGQEPQPEIEHLGQVFQQQIVPLVAEHCGPCHAGEQPEAGLELSHYQRLEDVTAAHPIWEAVLARVAAGEMPPADSEPPLPAAQRQRLVQWISRLREVEAQRMAGDPGPVLARRLSNVEYDHCIRDLTGWDLRPTQSFPVDPANAAGFDNSGESLSMSPALLNKYLQAARHVAEHMVLAPQGIEFAPHPVVTDTDRDKYCVKRIVAFYLRQPTDYADYFYAAWLYQRRSDQRLTLEAVAADQHVSPRYLRTIWEAIEQPPHRLGPWSELLARWQAVCSLEADGQASSAELETQARADCVALRDWLLAARKQFEPQFDNLVAEGIHKGSQPLVLWKNKQYATHRRTADLSRLQLTDEQAAQRPEIEAACRSFCSVFPDAFYISERGRDYLDKPREQQEKGRLLSAGFHSMMGYFRDDAPLMELILDEHGREELDDLWRELDFVTAAPQRQYQGFLWFERTDSRTMRDAEFDFARPEDKAALDEALIVRLSEVYLAKAQRNQASPTVLAAIADYFREINAQIRWVERARVEAESVQLEGLVALASRVFRRPLSAAHQQELRSFYRQLRLEEQLTHEEAMQDSLVSMLVSPQFFYRWDLLNNSLKPRALDDSELASRLSFFLWASLPDATLLELAAQGVLHQPEVLREQTRRMLADERARGLATEFAGNWLGFRRFEEHNSVDRQRFPNFDDQLRTAMFEEPIRFFLDVVQRDRSLLDLLYAEDTFVNRPLAEHYGLSELSFADDSQWVHVDDAQRVGRGGLLPMAVFMTQNAPGLRTSPVKRGYWVVRRLLGERIPPPPPNVPELPADEAELGELTLREALARHREHASCAGCHNRIDAIGLVFENYGPVGEWRSVDLGGRPVDPQAEFPDGSLRASLADLQDYIRASREAEFSRNFCEKLLAYALSRSLQLSDEGLLQQMQQAAQADGYRMQTLIETIVTSPQFLNKRGHATPVASAH